MKKYILLPVMILLHGAITPPADTLQRARQASQALLNQLQQALKTTLQSQGPATAIQVCQQMAPHIAQQVAETHRVKIRRVTLKTRNPANQADAFETALLRRWQHAATPQEYAEMVKDAKGHTVLRYLKPLKIQKICLQCHGPTQTIAPEVRVLLKKYYPLDKATGYREGELRGAVSVQIPIP